MKLRADNAVCEGHGQCAMTDDELFTLDADGYIAIGDGVDVPPGKEHAAELGVAACPVQALSIE